MCFFSIYRKQAFRKYEIYEQASERNNDHLSQYREIFVELQQYDSFSF